MDRSENEFECGTLDFISYNYAYVSDFILVFMRLIMFWQSLLYDFNNEERFERVGVLFYFRIFVCGCSVGVD